MLKKLISLIDWFHLAAAFLKAVFILRKFLQVQLNNWIWVNVFYYYFYEIKYNWALVEYVQNSTILSPHILRLKLYNCPNRIEAVMFILHSFFKKLYSFCWFLPVLLCENCNEHVLKCLVLLLLNERKHTMAPHADVRSKFLFEE